MKITLLVLSFSIILLYFLSKKKYSNDVALLDSQRYVLKHFIVIGLYILDLFKHKYNTSYDRMLYSKIIEFSGAKQSKYYLKIHLANKIVLLLLCVELILIIGVFITPDKGFCFFSCVLLLLIMYLTDNELNQRINKRRISLQIDFPDFLNKLVLLINAGMTVPRAWERAVSNSRNTGPLYNELKTVLAEIRAGKPETRAYADFAKRCKIPEITRFVSIMLQNLRKGNTELVYILRVHSNDCWQMRKNAAKKLGEEASTKMLLPLILMFIGILLIVITPAVLTLRNIN